MTGIVCCFAFSYCHHRNLVASPFSGDLLSLLLFSLLRFTKVKTSIRTFQAKVIENIKNCNRNRLSYLKSVTRLIQIILLSLTPIIIPDNTSNISGYVVQMFGLHHPKPFLSLCILAREKRRCNQRKPLLHIY